MNFTCVGKALRKTLACLLGASLVFSSDFHLFAYSNDAPSYSYQPPSITNNFRPEINSNINPNNFFNPQAFNFQSWLAPDLNLNMWTMRLPAIQVRDLGDSLWTFEKTGSHFNPELKLYDQYSANIRFSAGEIEAAEPIQMDLGKMKFNSGILTPQTFRQVFQDGVGNTLFRERNDQKAEVNPKYQQFVQYFQRQGAAGLRETSLSQGEGVGVRGNESSRPPDPSKELVLGFKESWNLTGHSEDRIQKSQAEFKINSIEYDSNLQRFISGYQGQVRDGKESISFEVKCPRDTDGKIQKLDVRMWEKGTPEARITWTPRPGPGQEKAFALLRNSLPVPLLIGPNTAIRLNGVDIPDSAVQVSNDGTLSAKQLGATQYLTNLVGKEDLGVHAAFSPPSTKNQESGFSLGNAFQNLWYMVTGRWSEVKGMRQQLTTLRDQEPGKFLLAAGFNDPIFMSLKDLRSAFQRLSKSSPVREENTGEISPIGKKTPTEVFDIIKAVIKAPFKLVGEIIGIVFDLPGVKQVTIGVRIVTGAAIGVLSGDIFDRSKPIEFDRDGPAVVTINGIKCDDSAARSIEKAGLDGFGIKSATVIKNGTHWFGIGDGIQILGYEYPGAIDKPVWDTAKAIRAGIEQKGEVFVIAYSQGTAVFKQALSLLSAKEKAAVHYIGLGPEWIVDGKTEGLASAHNVWNKGDFVPTLGNRLKLITNLLFPWNWGRLANRDVERHDVGAHWEEAHKFTYYVDSVKKWAAERRKEWFSSALQPAY